MVPIAALVLTVAQVVKELTPLALDAMKDLKSEDQGELQAALDELSSAADAQRAKTSKLLTGE